VYQLFDGRAFKYVMRIQAEPSGRVSGIEIEPIQPITVTVGAQMRTTTSLERLYRDEYASLLRLAYSLTSNRGLAEEMVQDTFVSAQRKWDFVATYEFQGVWLRRVLVNRCVSRHRRATNEIGLLLRLGNRRDQHEQSEPDARNTPLWEALAALPTRQRQVVALHYVDDASVADIAIILACGEETVRTHLRRGRSALADRLRNTGIKDES
jgi:RNA polymerase sigma-70 factor, ECF subfamily